VAGKAIFNLTKLLSLLNGQAGDKRIRLTWTLDTTLPSIGTWRIAYTGPAGNPPSPITGLAEPTRAYTLTDLTNYTWYTVTFNAMVGSEPHLTATVTAIPTEHLVYLPVVLRTDVPNFTPAPPLLETIGALTRSSFAGIRMIFTARPLSAKFSLLQSSRAREAQI